VRAERARWATARGARDQRWIRTRYLKYLGTKCSQSTSTIDRASAFLPEGCSPCRAIARKTMSRRPHVSLESTEILSPTSPSKPAPPIAVVMLPPPAVAPSRSRVSSREKDAAQGMKYEGVIDWLHYSPGPRVEQSRFTSVSVGDMYWRIVSPIRSQELVRARQHMGP
jgi:hypothetical protein